MEVNITIFEKTDRIGGRTLTVDVYDNPLEKVEVGASIFVSVNHILWNATDEFGLDRKDPYGSADELDVIWDGDKFVFESASTDSGWWDTAKLLWKYGLAPYKAQKLMQATLGTFLKLYDAPYFPFRSLSTRAFELDLTKVTGMTGEQYFAANNIAPAFTHDIIQAATRVNYASNLDRIHGLDTMVSMAPEGSKSVVGGNWQIFDRMVKNSGASVHLNTSVSSIALAKNKAGQAKYRISTKSTSSAAAVDTLEGIAFDQLILATPYQFSKISAGDGVFEEVIDEIPYVKLHVTLFASPFRLSADFFGLSPGAKVPTTVLTTLPPGQNSTSGIEGAGKTGFFSISTLRTVINPTTLKSEYLYKIFSPEAVTPELLSSLLGVKVSETFTGVAASEAIATENAGPETTDEEQIVEPISWLHPHIFHSYPKALPRVTFQDPILRSGLYYTSGMESFISTMETSALMGRNVARLIVDDALGLDTGHALDDQTPKSLSDDEVVKAVEVVEEVANSSDEL